MKSLRLFKRTFNVLDLVMITIIFGFFLFFYIIGHARHFSFLTSINDLGHFDQAVWSASQNGVQINSDIFNYKINHLGFHFTPILYFFSPLYKIHPTAIWLILSQAFSVAIAALPIYFLTEHLTSSKSVSIIWSLIFLLNPFIQNAVAWDFHPIVLTLPFITLALYGLLKKNFYLVLFSSIVFLLCKEHLGIMVSGFGALWYYKHKDIKGGAILLALGFFCFFFICEYLMPMFSPTGNHLMMSDGFGQLSRYSWLGESTKEIIINIIKNPYKVFCISIFKMQGYEYFILLLLPFLGLPILNLCFMIPSIADLLANILSVNTMPKSIFSYHSATIIPFLCLSAIFGCIKLSKITKKFTIMELSLFILLSTALLNFAFSPLPIPKSSNFWAPKKIRFSKNSSFEKVKELLPPSLSLSVQANIGAHFTQRELVFSFPNKIGEADAIVLNLDSPTNNIYRKEPMYIGSLAHHLQIRPEEYLNIVLDLLNNKKYGICYWNNNWLILKKNQNNLYPVDSVKKRIRILREKWR